MPHNVPPTPPPKKRPSFFKKSYSSNENTIQKIANGLSLESITSHPHVTPTVSIHRTTTEHHSSSSSEHTNHTPTHHANGIHNRAHQALLQKTNHATSTHNPVLPLAAKVENVRPPSPPKVKATESQLTLKQQNRSIGDCYLVGAWKKCQFIDTILYAYSDSDAVTSIPIPAHKILLKSYSGFCLKLFNVYPLASSALKQGLDTIGEPFKSNGDFCPSPEMTQLEIQRLSGNQIPILCIPIPFYDLLKLVTLMYMGEVVIEKQNLDSVQQSALVLKMNNINIVELGEMLIDSSGQAPSLSVQREDNSSKSRDHSSEGSFSCSSNSNRTSTSSPELNIERVSPSPPFISSTMSEGISLDLRTSPPEITPMPKLRTTASPLPMTTTTIPITNVPLERLQRLQHPQQLQQHHQAPQTTITPQTPSFFDFFLKTPNSLFTPYFTDLMTPPITPSTAGTSCSSGSSGSSGSQYPATPSIIQQNPFFSNASATQIFANLLTSSQMMNRQLSAPATLATNQIEGHSSPSLFLNNVHSKSASADEAGGSSPTHSGPPNRKRTQNLVHAAQYRDRRRQKIEQLYAEKDREEAKVNEQRNIIQKLCSQIEKLIDSQTRLSGEDGNTYRCPICSQNFGQLNTIRVHLNTAHPEKTCSSGPLSNVVVDPVSGQLHLRPPYRHSERDQKLLNDWLDAQKIAHDNFFSQQQSKQQQSKSLLENHIAHTSSMLIS